MTPEVAKIVGKEYQPPQLTQLGERLRGLVTMSRDEMKKYYTMWDNNDMVFRGERVADISDRQAMKRGEPQKMILPLTFGQVMTFTAFGHAAYNQRDFFFETIASGAEDEKPGQMAMAVLEQNLRKNKFRSTKVIQLLLDIARFGVGITKESWIHDRKMIKQQVPDQEFLAQARAGLVSPAAVPMKTEVVPVTKYLGNKVINVSPYRWFPDSRLPLSRWTEGEFCADEIEESQSKLADMERQGLVAGLDYVKPLDSVSFADRRLNFLRQGDAANSIGTRVDPQYYLLTEVQIRLNPAETEIDDGVFLDPEMDADQIYIVWILNDNRIVRISEAGYDHDEFGWNCAQFLDDQNRFINLSLAEMLSACQDTATWFLNSHITSVRKTIFNQLVVDPSGVEVDDIINRRPMIRLKPGRAGSGINNWLQQLQTVDVTQGHLSDVASLSSMAKESSGINENILGQFSSGRRSAREAGNVANNAAQRLLMIFSAVWESALEPLGTKMLSNLRQGLDEQTLVRVYGALNTQEASQPDLPGLPPPIYRLIKVDKADLIGNYDLSPFNGTLPTQRTQTAGVLQQILETMQKNPQLVLLTGLDPKLIFFEVLELLNIRNVQRFRLTPERLQQLTAMAGAAANSGGPRVAPGGVNRPAGPAQPTAPVTGPR